MSLGDEPNSVVAPGPCSSDPDTYTQGITSTAHHLLCPYSYSYSPLSHVALPCPSMCLFSLGVYAPHASLLTIFLPLAHSLSSITFPFGHLSIPFFHLSILFYPLVLSHGISVGFVFCTCLIIACLAHQCHHILRTLASTVLSV